MAVFSAIANLAGNIFGGAQKRKQAEAEARAQEAISRARQAEAQARALQAASQASESGKAKDKTALYIGGGVGVLGLLYLLTGRNKRRRR